MMVSSKDLPVGALPAKSKGWCNVTRRSAHEGNVCMLSHKALGCWCNLFMLRENLLLQSSRVANHNQNSYIRTACEEAYLILRQVSDVLSSHCLVLAEAQCQGRVLSSPCNSSCRRPPQPEETVFLGCVISLGLVHACTEQLCWQYVLLNHLLKQFSMVAFRPLILPSLLARAIGMEVCREPGTVSFPMDTTMGWHHVWVEVKGLKNWCMGLRWKEQVESQGKWQTVVCKDKCQKSF